MDLETLGKRIVYARKLMDMQQTELSSRSGVKQTTLSKIELGRQKRSGDIAKLADVLNVNAVWLSDGIGPMRSDVEFVVGPPAQPDDVMLYQYTDARCELSPESARQGELPAIAFAASVFERLELDPSQCFALIAPDKAMAETLAEGDHALVHARERDPARQSGKIFVIENNGVCVPRRIYVNSMGGYRITAEPGQRDEFPDETIPASDADGIKIVGRVRYSGGYK